MKYFYGVISFIYGCMCIYQWAIGKGWNDALFTQSMVALAIQKLDNLK